MLVVLSCDLSLITIHISDYRQFSDFYISQGSVATCQVWWDISIRFCCKFTTKCVAAKFFKNRLTFGKVMGKSLVSCFLLTHGVVLQTVNYFRNSA